MCQQPPFALFVIAPDIDTEYINNVLVRGRKGNFDAGWQLWVASASYADAPKFPAENRIADGSVAPIPNSFTSPFIGKSIMDCAQWLTQMPPDVALNRTHFTLLDEFSKDDDTVLTCRYVEIMQTDDGEGNWCWKGTGEWKLEWFPVITEHIIMYTGTNGPRFDERAQGYQAGQMKNGKPDRSRAGPYWAPLREKTYGLANR